MLRQRHLGRTALMAALVLLAAGGLVAVTRSGWAIDLVCPESVTGYAHVPFPAPLLIGDARLTVGQEVSVGGYTEALPSKRVPTLAGDTTVVRVRTVVKPTVERCGRIVEGYQFLVLTAVRPGTMTVEAPPQPPRTIVVVG
jgi:hypothetical protein